MKHFIFLFATLLHHSVVFAYKRNMTYEINPGCNLPTTHECDQPWVLYAEGKGDNDTIQYLWGSMNLPTFIMIRNSPSAQIEIDWPELEMMSAKSIILTPVPYDIFAISFQKLILFNDIDDTGKLDNVTSGNQTVIGLEEFDWKVDIDGKNDILHQFTATFETTHFRGETLAPDQKISILLTAFGKSDRYEQLPHLLVTPESCEVEILLQNLVLNLNNTQNVFEKPHHHNRHGDIIPIGGYRHPRWALDYIMLSSDEESDGERYLYSTRKSLDDEYTPGVFNLDKITTPSARKPSPVNIGSYLEWRPVAYLTKDRDINFATTPNINTALPPADQQHISDAQNSLLYALFGNNIDHLLSAQTTVAFGQPKDGFYTSDNFTLWCYTMGLGDAPKETFSPFVIIFISVGVGLPMLLFIIGGVYVTYKKIKTRGSQREPLIQN